jgi:hypothetical protein
MLAAAGVGAAGIEQAGEPGGAAGEAVAEGAAAGGAAAGVAAGTIAGAAGTAAGAKNAYGPLDEEQKKNVLAAVHRYIGDESESLVAAVCVI